MQVRAKAAGKSLFTPAPTRLLQRKCACGGKPGLDGECAECRQNRFTAQPNSTGQAAPTATSASFGRDFGRVRVNEDSPGTIQTKLTINEPGDKFEQEADRVADDIMRMPEPTIGAQEDFKDVSAQTSRSSLRRFGFGCEEQLYRQPVDDEEEEEEGLVQTKPLVGSRLAGGEGGNDAPPVVHEVLCSPGRPLDPSTRSFMESRFAHDFSQVRVHTDARAAKSAQAVQARAFTLGSDVVFREGQYAPETTKGKRLLAHELTHVVQQSTGPNRKVGLQIGPANNHHEQEADRMTERVMQGSALGKISPTTAVHLQRHPAVGFVVHGLQLTDGRLDDPDQSIPGTVTWPLSFAVTSPLEAEADVEITGAAGDPCAAYDIGFLQTVRTNWLHYYYWGQSTGHGSTIVKNTAPVPIRDGEPGTFWYTAAAHEAPAGCNVHVNPTMDDYPTIFRLPKVHANTITGQPNYLTGVRRGIGFVTTLVASGPAGFRPLRYFYWNYQMAIDFTPNYANPNAVWPIAWKTNKSNLGTVHTGADPTVPHYTTPDVPYNQSLVRAVSERR